MQQNDKEKNRFPLDVIAKELAALAYDLVNGKLRIGSSLVSIGDPLFFKSKQKIKDGKAYFTLSFQSPLHDDDQVPPADITSNTKTPNRSDGQKTAKPKTNDFKASGAPDAKKLKKEIGRLWKSVVKQIEQDQPQSQNEAAKLLKKCEDYTVFAESSWQAKWSSCCNNVKKCLDAAVNDEMVTAKELAAVVDHAIRDCHKKYK